MSYAPAENLHSVEGPNRIAVGWSATLPVRCECGCAQRKIAVIYGFFFSRN
jgi:hypothetical protein